MDNELSLTNTRPKGAPVTQWNDPYGAPINGPLDFLETDFFNEIFAKKEDGTRSLQVEIQLNTQDMLMIGGAIAGGYLIGGAILKQL